MATVNTIATTLPAAPQQNSFLSDEAKRRLLAAQLLQRQGADASAPVYTTGHGLAKLGAGLAGGLMEGLTEAREAELNKENAALIGQFLMAGQGGAPATASPSITSEPLSPAVTSPPASSRVYSENEFNPLDAAVATPKELAVGVPAPAQYAPTIGKAAVDNDIPPQLLAAQIKQESGFNPNAVSPAGAQGISQFMPGTAAEMGINPLDPNQAIPAGARYLRQQIDKFGGSIPHGLAAYNGGPGRLERAGGDISRMPAETRQYVQNVQQMAGGDPAALPPNAAPTQGYAIPGQPSPQAIAAGLQNPNAGNPNRLAIAAQLLSDPRTPPHMRALIAQQMTPDNQLMQMPDGTVVQIDKRSGTTRELYKSGPKPVEVNGRLVNPQTGQVIADFSNPQTATVGNDLVDTRTGRVIHQGNKSPTYGVIAEDQFGNKQYGWINPATQTTAPGAGSGPPTSGAPATVSGPNGAQIEVPPGVNPKKFRDDVTSATADAAVGKKTEVQAKSEKFGNKMELAEKNLKDIEGQGTSTLGRLSEGSDWVPGSSAIGNYLQPANYQKYRQARDNFITALLRDESGAAIGTPEFNRYEKELFPQPGDSKGVIEQKREARRVAIEGMKKAAGPGYKSPADLQGPVKVSSPDEARKLPKGTKIILPDGTEGVVP